MGPGTMVALGFNAATGSGDLLPSVGMSWELHHPECKVLKKNNLKYKKLQCFSRNYIALNADFKKKTT